MRWVARPLDFFVLKQAKPFKDPLNGFFLMNGYLSVNHFIVII
jgi:hypothetical protein